MTTQMVHEVAIYTIAVVALALAALLTWHML
jgi:hypothetical protein